MLFLRAGWVVGNAGFLGAVVLIVVAFLITGTTALSLSSVTTNIRIGAGGAYSIISRSLGIEVAGSIGIPLYLAQTLIVTLYIFAFREGWLELFPQHPALAVDLVVLVLILGIAAVSAGLSFRVQYVVLALIAASLISVAAAAFSAPFDEPITLWGEFPGAPEEGFEPMTFWQVFAIFFPAATGILVGVNMSGELRDPRRSIPRGTMAAVGVAIVVYIALAYWFARIAPPTALVSNYTVMVDRAFVPEVVLAGLLGSAFSSALAALALRELNAIAPLITMFFLITYAMLNVVVLIEQRLGQVSFPPLLRIPPSVALTGAVGCSVTMFIINPLFSLLAIVIVVLVYGYLNRRQLNAPYGDVRSGLFRAVAEWGVKKATRVQGTDERSWKPNLLIPVEDATELRGTFLLIHDLASPRGALNIMGVAPADKRAALSQDLQIAAGQFRDEEVFATWAVVEADRYVDGFVAGMGALHGAFFHPNMVFLTMPHDVDRARDLYEVVDRAPDYELGIVLFADHPRANLGRRHSINIWISTPDWESAHGVAEVDLALLLGYKLQQNWQGRMRLLTAVASEEEKPRAREQLTQLINLARLPNAETYAMAATFEDALRRAPTADINLFGLPTEIDFEDAQRTVTLVDTACLFVRGSGHESVVA